MTTLPITSSIDPIGPGGSTDLLQLQAGLRLASSAGEALATDDRAKDSADDSAGTDSFAHFLTMARETFNRSGGADQNREMKTKEDVVRAGARELVATAFFEPLFKMMREDPLKADVVPVSAGEKMFGPMLHSEFAKRITEKGNFPLVDAIVRSLLPESTKPEPKASEESAPDETTNEASNPATPPQVTTSDLAQQDKRKVDMHG